MTHRFHGVAQADRAALCAELVTAQGASVVFVRTRHGADRLARQLERSGVSSAAIHGDRSQAQRDRALAAFRGGKVQALVATDVAARGIHVDDVDCVIHYDPPPDPKDYVHRSGRTARAGASGTVVTLVTPDQRKAVEGVWRALGLEPELVDLASSNGSSSNGSGRGRASAARPTAPVPAPTEARPKSLAPGSVPPISAPAAAATRQRPMHTGPQGATRRNRRPEGPRSVRDGQ